MFKNKQIPLIYLLLTAAVIIAFWQVRQCDFISYDDRDYVTENTHIQGGITPEAIRWAFTAGYAGNWHPITWMSHMLDIQLFGLDPHRHHLVNLLFHVLNTLLLFFVFNRMTKAPWKSAFVAALFGLHPLHVESVAWVAERKDVLSTFFWMLAMAAYIRYVETQRLKNYLAVLVFFVLGLMSKPMLVTFPFVLLLMDYWPLGRMQGAGSAKNRSREQGAGSGEPEPLSTNKKKGKSGKKLALGSKPAPDSIRGPGQTSRGVQLPERPADNRFQWGLVRALLMEKIPFFALAALSCIVTLIVQQKGGAVRSLEALPLGVRIANALVSYNVYIAKMIWPDKLAVFYPHPGLPALWQISGAVMLFAVVTVAAVRTANRFPYLPVGWLWFTGALVPVIGIVQAGAQSMADRYTYIPLIGLFIVAAWGTPQLLAKWRYCKEALFASSALILSCLSIVTWTQAGFWRESISLFDHTLKVTSRNDIIYYNRAAVYQRLDNLRQAISDYDTAIEINPTNVDAYINRGIAYRKLGNMRQAMSDYDRAIEINPTYFDAYNNRGLAYDKLGSYRQAISDYDRAIAINPNKADAYNNRGVAYVGVGNYKQAMSDYDKAIDINPKYADAYSNRGIVYSKLGNNEQALFDYNMAIEIDPKHARAFYNRGVANAKHGNTRQGISDFDKVIDIDPKYTDAYYNRGFANAELGNYRQAIEDYSRTIDLDPRYVRAFYNRSAAYHELGLEAEAIEDLKMAARFDSEEARNFLRSQGISW